jgi:Ca-activated chloride channel homolog
MVMEPWIIAALAACGIIISMTIAEILHAQRSRRVSHLAFGAKARARRWAVAAPLLRVLAATSLVWGLWILFLTAPTVIEKEPTQEASKHLLVCLDASPSMFVEDAGADGKTKRAIWAGQVVQAILDRLDTETTRVTVFAVYTKSIPVIEDTFDANVVRNLLDGLPLYAAFNAGPTKLSSGVNEALEYARQWKANSATLLVVSDGDSEEAVNVRSIPPSIADSIVVGVGDPLRPTMIAGHRSTQDTQSLKLLAKKLDGVYHQGNSKHLPSQVLDQLTMIRPRIGEGVGLRDLAILCVGIGGGVLCMLGPMLILLGRSHREHPVRVPRLDRLLANEKRPNEKSQPTNGWTLKGGM